MWVSADGKKRNRDHHDIVPGVVKAKKELHIQHCIILRYALIFSSLKVKSWLSVIILC
jgi:hypothetical protein